MKSKSLSPRAIAAQILTQVLINGTSLSQALKINLPANQDRGFIQELCYGVLRWYWPLNLITKLLLSTSLKEKDADIHALLLLGLYQLMHLQTPAHAAVHATVEAANELNKPWATKLINGVLRQFLRTQDELNEQINTSIVTRYSHPKWLLKLLQQAWPEQWENIVAANNQRPPFSLRVNRLKNSRENYLQLLSDENIAAEPIFATQDGLMLTTPCDVTHLPGFAKGCISVQDAAAQLAASLLDLAPGQSVLDACAAPGGKTTHLLETEPNLKEVIALEIDEERCKRISENLTRLELSSSAVKIICADAAKPETWWDQQLFDRILLDAPCSATGVIRRHPDIKLLRRAEDIPTLAELQLQLLTTLWKLLKPGGLLVYATCSVLPQENFHVLQNFLSQQADATEKKIDANWGIACPLGRQILPGENNMDGFYYACLQKKKTET